VLDDSEAGGVIVTISSRVLKRSLGPTAWAVLEDVVLDAIPHEDRWLARTSTRQVADHLGLTPGTVARALARLCTEGIVHREDRRDADTGRFGETVYAVVPVAALRPCVDPPHTVRRSTATPPTAERDTEKRETARQDPEPRSTAAHRRGGPSESGPNHRPPTSSGRRRSGIDSVQLPLLSEEPPGGNPAASEHSTPTPRVPLHPTPPSPTSHDPKSQTRSTAEPHYPTTHRPSDTCQVFDQALPGRASC